MNHFSPGGFKRLNWNALWFLGVAFGFAILLVILEFMFVLSL